MRVDLYLKYTKLVPRRVLGKSLIEGGNVLINDKVAKPSSQVKNEDCLTIYLDNMTLIIEVAITKEGNKIILGGKLIDKKEKGIFKC